MGVDNLSDQWQEFVWFLTEFINDEMDFEVIPCVGSWEELESVTDVSRYVRIGMDHVGLTDDDGLSSAIAEVAYQLFVGHYL